MQAAPHPRVTRVERGGDDTSAWSMLRVAPSAALLGLVDGYCDYDERTAGPTTRRMGMA